MATLLNGKTVAEKIRERVSGEVEALKKTGITPSLHVILAGEDPASKIYVSSKAKQSAEVGIAGEIHAHPASLSQEELLEIIDNLNRDDSVHGILVQLPLPDSINEFEIIRSIDPAKDVDGFHPHNVGLLSLGNSTLEPCTPAGVMELLHHYDIPIKGAHAVIIGRSNIVGKPMAMMLLREHATVTLCHSRTRDLPSVCREADILIAAVGRPGMVDSSYIKKGATIVDVGVNRLTGAEEVQRFFSGNEKKRNFFDRKGYVLIGDVHYDSAFEVAGAITPVPGGVGPLTIAMLLSNTVRAARLRGGAQLIAGLTGGIGCGKSTTLAIFSALGCHTLSADQIVHDLYREKGPVVDELTAVFGTGILDEDGSISISNLSGILSVPEKAERLNAIVHPHVMARISTLYRDLKGDDPAVLLIVETPLLFEASLEKEFDVTICVTCPEEIGLERFSGYRDLPIETARIRAARQLPTAEKAALSDYIIDNSGSREELESEVRQVYECLKKSD